VTLALLVSGCATTGPDDGTADRPSPPAATASEAASPTTVPSPTLRPSGAPSAPPKKPTDGLPSDRIAGRVTRGGSGPCYGVVTDDGTEYALYGTGAGTLQVGSHVRVTIAPLLLKISCGPGIPASIVELSVVR